MPVRAVARMAAIQSAVTTHACDRLRDAAFAGMSLPLVSGAAFFADAAFAAAAGRLRETAAGRLRAFLESMALPRHQSYARPPPPPPSQPPPQPLRERELPPSVAIPLEGGRVPGHQTADPIPCRPGAASRGPPARLLGAH